MVLAVFGYEIYLVFVNHHRKKRHVYDGQKQIEQ